MRGKFEWFVYNYLILGRKCVFGCLGIGLEIVKILYVVDI